MGVQAMSKLKGRWSITEMELWDKDYIDLVEPGYIKFEDYNVGEFVFGTINGFIDYRLTKEGGAEKAEFSWSGLT